jgi:hypothetical protein
MHREIARRNELRGGRDWQQTERRARAKERAAIQKPSSSSSQSMNLCHNDRFATGP